MVSTLLDYLKPLEQNPGRTLFYSKTLYRTFPVTARQFQERISRVLSYFESKNLKAGDKVLIWGRNSPDWAVCYLACLLKRIVAVPMDVRGSADFVEKIFAFVKAKLVICDSERVGQIPNTERISFEELMETGRLHKYHQISGVGAYGDTPLRLPEFPEISPDDTAEILFTSGTTGEPKGVVLTHRNIVSNVEALEACLKDGFRPDEKWLSLLPLSHIFEQTIGFWLPFKRGCPIVYLEVLKTSLILKSMAEDRVTVCPVVPRLLKLFQSGILREAERQQNSGFLQTALALARHGPLVLRRSLFSAVRKKFGALRYFVAGGATLERELEEFWRLLGFQVLQGYGLSETAPVISCNFPHANRLGSIGKVLPGVEVRLSAEGEILARGPSVFGGYYERPNLTEEVFEEGWFKTGDLGAFDSDGFLWFKGRAKELIVTAEGLNVYPQDIEAELHKIRGVKESCVLGLEENGKVVIYAAVLLENSARDPKQIMEQVNLKLADHQKIQSLSVWPQEDFPRTSTMKIKRREVLRIIQARGAASEPSAEKKKPVSRLYEVIAPLANVPPSGLRAGSTLEELGFSSLDRLELATALEEEFHFSIDDSALLGQTTLREIEKMVETGKGTDETLKFPKWQASRRLFAVHAAIQNVLAFPILRCFCKIRVEGAENLRDLKGPAIFISNHISFFDGPVILASLPKPIRRELAIAVWREFFEPQAGSPWQTKNPLWWVWIRFWYYLVSLGVNVFPFSQERGFGKNFEHSGWLLDRGFHLLFFPEGARTQDGRMVPFQKGLEVLVRSIQVPVVPIGLNGLFEIYPVQNKLPHPGKVVCRFGAPITFGRSAENIAETLKQAVAKLLD